MRGNSYKRSLFFPHSSTIMSMDSGYVYPALVREMYPNDKIIISHEALLKAAPMLFPSYSSMKLRFDYFFNENRNVWRGDEKTDWSAFFTASVAGKRIENLDDLPEHPFITVPEGGFPAGSLGDYLGFTSDPALAGAKVSALRFRHYNEILKWYYLDENFSTMPNISYAAGEDTTTDLTLRKCCWNKDRFTTAATEPQKGLSIGIPLSGDIPVDNNPEPSSDNVFRPILYNGSGQHLGRTPLAIGDDGKLQNMNEPANLGSVAVNMSLVAKISEATSIPVDELHFLVQLERLNQRENFWGSRDFECIRTHFGCNIPDTRLQKPTHLGYSVVDVHFSEVLQTSQSTADSPQGNITGHTMAVDANRPVRFHCLEHGFLFVMVTLMPVAQYQQGIPRDALYQTRYDYMWPILSETGEQELFEAELYATAANVNSRKIFGFEPRYNHLRFGEKTVHGDFRTSLTGYHMGRIFTEEPNLNENFITADPTKRMFAVELQNVQPYWLRLEFNIKHVRRLPQWPTPAAIGKVF